MISKGKITINHNLNKKLKPTEKNRYSLYVQVTAKRDTTQFKSLIDPQYFSEEEFKDVLVGKGIKARVIRSQLEEEKIDIETILSFLNLFERQDFYLGSLSRIYGHYILLKRDFINSAVKEWLRSQIKEIGHKELEAILNWELPTSQIIKALIGIIDDVKYEKLSRLFHSSMGADLVMLEFFPRYFNYVVKFKFDSSNGKFIGFDEALASEQFRRFFDKTPDSSYKLILQIAHSKLIEFAKTSFLLSKKDSFK